MLTMTQSVCCVSLILMYNWKHVGRKLLSRELSVTLHQRGDSSAATYFGVGLQFLTVRIVLSGCSLVHADKITLTNLTKNKKMTTNKTTTTTKFGSLFYVTLSLWTAEFTNQLQFTSGGHSSYKQVLQFNS